MNSFIIYILVLFVTVNCSVIIPKIRIICGEERKVAHANVYIYEEHESDEYELPIERTFEKTNEEGILKSDFLKHYHPNHIHIKIRDKCQIEEDKILCNFSYNEFYVPLRIFYNSGKEIVLNLAEKKYKDHRVPRCL